MNHLFDFEKFFRKICRNSGPKRKTNTSYTLFVEQRCKWQVSEKSRRWRDFCWESGNWKSGESVEGRYRWREEWIDKSNDSSYRTKFPFYIPTRFFLPSPCVRFERHYHHLAGSGLYRSVYRRSRFRFRKWEKRDFFRKIIKKRRVRVRGKRGEGEGARGRERGNPRS